LGEKLLNFGHFCNEEQISSLENTPKKSLTTSTGEKWLNFGKHTKEKKSLTTSRVLQAPLWLNFGKHTKEKF